jgi:predicted acyltransferase
MIFVNDPGDWGHLYWPFDHAEWHGWTPTDLIFPFFLFIVGTAGVFSLEKRMAAGATRPGLSRHAFTRGMLIVLVGWAMAWFPFTLERLGRLRIPGVLPRIGLTYFLGTWIVLAVWRRRRAGVAVAILVLLTLHTILLGYTGYDLTREGNLQRALDLALLKGHLWKKDGDPEGILSTLTAVATMLTGTLTGFLLRSPGSTAGKTWRLFFWGIGGIFVGHFWGEVLPINKNLWTGSYVVLTSGFACFFLALSMWAVDIHGVKKPFAFFFTFGRNPLLVFVLSGLLAKTLGLVKWMGPGGKTISLHGFLYRGAFSWIPDPTLASHAFALATVLFWWVVLLGFEKKGWYWKI